MANDMHMLQLVADNGTFVFLVMDKNARDAIGDLEQLLTSQKGNLVAAINELVRNGGGGAGVVARVAEVNLLAANWVATENENKYSQVVNIAGITENSQVDLTPSADQLVIFYEKDLALVAENEGGTVTVYAIGQKPTGDYTMQVTITEVDA